MVRTVVNIDRLVYEKLVKEAIRRYGHSKNISKVLNEILSKYFGIRRKKKFFSETIKIGRKLEPEDIRKLRVEGFMEAALYGGLG